MDNNFLIKVIWLSLFSILIGLVGLLFYPEKSFIFLNAGIGFLELSGTYLLFKNGTYNKSPLYNFSLLGVSIFILGIMFKIMHWPGSAMCILAGFFIFFGFYMAHFFKKSTKSIADHLKILFVLTLITSRYFQLMRWPNDWMISVLEILTLITILTLLFKKEILMNDQNNNKPLDYEQFK